MSLINLSSSLNQSLTHSLLYILHSLTFITLLLLQPTLFRMVSPSLKHKKLPEETNLTKNQKMQFTILSTLFFVASALAAPTVVVGAGPAAGAGAVAGAGAGAAAGVHAGLDAHAGAKAGAKAGAGAGVGA